MAGVITETIKQSWEDWLLEQGEAKGKAEGKAEGELQTRRDDLRALLQDRFGDLPDEILQRIEATTDATRLKTYLLQVWHINSPEELDL